jgi:drug/metabolite transporter (DMT)-like permease
MTPQPAPSAPKFPPLIIACLAATWLIWGSTYLVIRFALAGFAPFFMMSTRFFCAGLLLFLWQRIHGAPLPTAREWRNAALVGSLMLGGGMGGTAFAEMSVGSGLVVAFIAVTPVILVLINLLFRIVPSRRELAAVALGLTGVLMLTQGRAFQASPAGLAAIATAVSCWSTGSILSLRGFKLAAGPMGFASEMLCGGLTLLLLSLLRGESWGLPAQPGPYLAWAYLVILGSLVAFSAYMILLARVPTSLASSYTLVNPLVALALGVSVGGERVSAGEWLAAAVILGAVLLLFVRRNTPGLRKATQ